MLGLAGLLGSGRTETARLLFGVDRADAGTVQLGGVRRRFGSPREAMRAGLAYCPEERKTEGIVAELSVRENIALALQAKRGVVCATSPGPSNRPWPKPGCAKWASRRLASTCRSVSSPAGNQQKAVLARWLATEPRLLILDEPTRGIDVAAKQEIMELVLALCRRGLGLVFISSEMPEVLRVSHRIAVMRDRRKVAELANDTLSEADIFRVIAGSPIDTTPAGGRMNEPNASVRPWQRLRQHTLFWPCMALLGLVLLNGRFNPGFFSLSWRDGHLYGPIVDVLNRAAPLMAVSLGMTVVIATRGIDISVGAIVAIAAAVAATLVGGSLVIQDGQQVYVTRTSLPLALLAALGVAALCGLWNGLLVGVGGIQPIIATLILMVAGRGIAQLLTNGPDHHHLLRTVLLQSATVICSAFPSRSTSSRHWPC